MLFNLFLRVLNHFQRRSRMQAHTAFLAFEQTKNISREVVKVHYAVPVKQSHALWDAAKCRSEKGMESLALLEACGQVALLIRTITV